MRALPIVFVGLILAAGTATAQHEGHHPAAAPTPPPATTPMSTPTAGMSPSSAATPSAPPEVGNPDPMAAMEEMEPMDHWMTMAHGYAFLTANRQGGPSGDREFESQNHLMLTAVRRLWGGKLSLLGTFTLEPATIPPRGSAELFERGETYRNVLLIDRQHPHDLFVQIAAAWERSISGSAKVRLYLAPWGEPALGPVAFPHRLSASENPTAPLSHHNQDSTHIAADVATVGLTASIFTLEASAFHGREPDENRWDIEQGRLDSWSGRLTVRPTRELSFQISSGHLEHPESSEPGNQTRSTASVTYQKATTGGFFAATAVAGRNQTRDGPEWGNLLEWTWKFAGKNFLYGRLESVDRDFYELVHKRQRPENVARERTLVQAGTLGFARDVPWFGEVETGLGADVTLYSFTSRLDSVYGRRPVSLHGFVRIRFGSHSGMPDMDHSQMNMPGMAQPPQSPPTPGQTMEMDHSKMHMPGVAQPPQSPTTSGQTKEIDHSQMNMPGMAQPPQSPTTSGQTKEIDHSKMHMPVAPPPKSLLVPGKTKGMDHSKMNLPGMAKRPKRPPTPGQTKGMDHSKMNMAGTNAPSQKATTPSASSERKEMSQGSQPTSTRDPVCGKEVGTSAAHRATYQGKTYYFCSRADRERFLSDPAAYVKR